MRRIGLSFAFCVVWALILINFASRGLDDFDSFSFALALDHFDISLQQPQAPGFPVYILLARMFRAFMGDTQTAFIVLSALSGAASLVLVAEIGAALGSRRGGIIAALVLALMPAVWIHSSVALSDMPGIAFTLAAIYALLRAKDGDNWFTAGCFLAGLSLGVRLQNALPVGLVGLLALGWIIQRQAWKTLLAGGMVAVISILVWLVPTLITTDGLDGYLTLIRAHGEHVTANDSLLGRGESLQARWEAFVAGWRWIVGGDGTLFSTGLIVLLGGLLRVKWRSGAALLLLMWSVGSALKLFLLESLERPRLYLPVLIPLVLLGAIGWSRWRPAFRVIPCAYAFALFLQTIPLASGLHQTPSAPEQALAWIQSAYPKEETILITQGSFRAAQVILPQYPLLYTGQYDADTWRTQVDSVQPRYLVILDKDDLPPGWIEAISADYIPIADRTFERDARIFPQHVTVRTQVLTRLDLLSAEQLVLANDRIDIVDPASGKFFGEGWYRVEDVGGVIARWADQGAVMRVTLPAQDLDLSFSATPFKETQQVTVLLNSVEIDTVTLSGIWQTYTVSIPAEAIHADEINTITLLHARADIPDGSPRRLAAAYAWFEFSP